MWQFGGGRGELRVKMLECLTVFPFCVSRLCLDGRYRKRISIPLIGDSNGLYGHHTLRAFLFAKGVC